MEDARIPVRYAHCELEGFGLTDNWRNPTLERAKSLSERFAQEYPTSTPFGLLFMGPPGVGKTHLAVGIIRKLIRDKSVRCLFRTFPDSLNEVTILTTNYLEQEDLKSARKSVSFSLTERIGSPTRSRLYEMCKTVVMQGEDFRQRFKPDEHRL